MNKQFAANVSNTVIPAISERDREADEAEICTAQLEQLKGERACAQQGHHRAILDAAIHNLQSQLEYALERRRVKADILRYESERRFERERTYRSLHAR
jgi:hypothetical protein